MPRGSRPHSGHRSHRRRWSGRPQDPARASGPVARYAAAACDSCGKQLRVPLDPGQPAPPAITAADRIPCPLCAAGWLRSATIDELREEVL